MKKFIVIGSLVFFIAIVIACYRDASVNSKKYVNQIEETTPTYSSVNETMAG